MRLRALLIAGVLLLASCGSDSGARTSSPTPPAPGSTPVVATSPSPAPTLEGTFAAVPLRRYLPMWNVPGAQVADFTFDARDPFGDISRLLVDGVRADDAGDLWYRLLLPVRPNGRTAWVRQNEVRLIRLRGRIVVDLSERTLRYWIGRRLVDRFRVGVGLPQFPTALGTFYVWIKVSYPDPNGPYGAYALGLSGFSPVLSDWPGGGRMAIHGTTDPSDQGREVSHGCIRVYNPDMLKLRGVPLGTPVIIRR